MKISISTKKEAWSALYGSGGVGDVSFVFVLAFAFAFVLAFVFAFAFVLAFVFVFAFVLAFVFVFAWPKRMVGQLWMGVAGRSVTLTFVHNYFLVSPNVSCTGHPARFR